MINKTVVIVGSVALLGVGAYIYFTSKETDKNVVGAGNLGGANSGSTNSTDNSGANSLDNIVVQAKDPVTNEPLKNPIVRTLTDADILAIQKLKDTILSDMRKKETYRKQSSRDNIQTVINDNYKKLKAYGYSLDLNNNLIKIA